MLLLVCRDFVDLSFEYSIYAKCAGASGSAEDAMMWWMKVFDATLGLPMQVSRNVRARAWSCLAHGFGVDSHNRSGTTVNIDGVYRAAQCADEAAQLGFVSPATLCIADKIHKYRTVPNNFRLNSNAPCFQELGFLWKAHEERMKEVEAEASERNAKTARRPAAYRCAAVGCGIEATSKSGLVRCSGKCPADVKPSYCSKECQRKVRIRSLFSAEVIYVCE